MFGVVQVRRLLLRTTDYPLTDDPNKFIEHYETRIGLMVPINRCEMKIDSKEARLELRLNGMETLGKNEEKILYTQDMQGAIAFIKQFYHLQKTYKNMFFPAPTVAASAT